MAESDSSRDYHRMQDAHTNAYLARLLSMLALIGASIALAVALTAMNKATDALNLSNRNADILQEQR